MFVERDDNLWNEIESLAGVDGLSVYDIEKPSSDKVRVFIHRLTTEAEGAVSAQAGVSSDDCARLLRRLQSFFLAEGSNFGVSADPLLEVSSPGINRKLRLREQFEKAIGERVKIIWEGGSGSVVGELCNITERELVINAEGEKSPVSVPFAAVKKANVDFKF